MKNSPISSLIGSPDSSEKITGGLVRITGELVRKTGGYKSECIVMENKSIVTEAKSIGYMRKSIGYSQNNAGYCTKRTKQGLSSNQIRTKLQQKCENTMDKL